MSLRSVPYGQLVFRQSQHIIFEPPPSFRASGGVCRLRACQLNICSTIYKTPYNIFTRAAAFCGVFCVARRYTMPVPRPDRNGSHQTQFRINKKKIYATQTVCGICGKPVDFSLKYPHPLSACIDHIIPIAKGGHPSALENLQLAHWCCNRQKSDKLVEKQVFDQKVEAVSNRVLPQTFDWKSI